MNFSESIHLSNYCIYELFKTAEVSSNLKKKKKKFRDRGSGTIFVTLFSCFGRFREELQIEVV